MKKWLIMLVTGAMMAVSAVAFANLDDTRATIAARYGDYRLVIDTDNQPWTKEEWETKGVQRARAASFMHSYQANGLRVQLEVMYDNNKPGSFVRAQRFTPDMAIKIKDFKTYFPEIYALITGPKAEAFATYKEISRNFQEQKSPVSMGIVVQSLPAPGKSNIYTLVAFNIQDEGRLIKDAKFINEDTYIREFTVEPVLRLDAGEYLGKDWAYIKNYFKK
ncbi:MAG: hypothetical protein N2491_03440 [Negativicutes bacterium]|nr:hypothetical protein [Negativicutes bacterium]